MKRNLIDLKSLSTELKRPVGTLIALAMANDPFYFMPSRVRDAEWFAELWRTYGRPGLHPHGLHYILLTKPGEITVPSTGAPYENTVACDNLLGCAARDARYLGLIPASDMIDRRNAEAEILHSNESGLPYGGIIDQSFGGLEFHLAESVMDFPPLPKLQVLPPKIPQPYMVEIWIEKSTMADVIDPIARRYGVNVVSGMGQTSETRSRELVERANEAGKPVRILYVSDFDPAGDNMPVAAARKMEFWIRTEYPDLDVQLRPVALTKDQCIEYRLSRTPLKEKGRAAWEEKHGEGATELDALEAVHPGVLGCILTEEIERYYDDTLQERIDDIESDVDAELDEINDEAHARHRAKIKSLRDQHARLTKEVSKEVKAVQNKYYKQFKALNAEIKTVWDAITNSLDGRYDFDSIDWPEPNEADEDDDPLFDSTRDYVEQIDRFKEHQGRPTTRKPREKYDQNVSQADRYRRAAAWQQGRRK
jgi:hypothetical protein